MTTIWQNQASCAGDMTFGENPDNAADTCAACPVIAECRTWVESEPAFTGWAAGVEWIDTRTRHVTRNQRRALREPRRGETTTAYRAAVEEWIEGTG